MKYYVRKIVCSLDLIVIGYLIKQYLIGNFTDIHLALFIGCVALLIIMIAAKFLRRIIFWPIKMIKKIFFRGWI
jgi:uncharacterized membrane protein